MKNKWETIKDKYKDYNNIECLKLDVTDKNDRQKVEMLDIDIFISNAAIGEGGSISEIPFDKVRRNLNTMVRKKIKAIDSNDNKFIYSAPFSQLLYSKLYNLFKY